MILNCFYQTAMFPMTSEGRSKVSSRCCKLKEGTIKQRRCKSDRKECVWGKSESAKEYYNKSRNV